MLFSAVSFQIIQSNYLIKIVWSARTNSQYFYAVSFKLKKNWIQIVSNTVSTSLELFQL